MSDFVIPFCTKTNSDEELICIDLTKNHKVLLNKVPTTMMESILKYLSNENEKFIKDLKDMIYDYQTLKERFVNNCISNYDTIMNNIKECFDEKKSLNYLVVSYFDDNYDFISNELKSILHVLDLIKNELELKGYKPEIIKDYEFINNLDNTLPCKEIKLTLVCDF